MKPHKINKKTLNLVFKQNQDDRMSDDCREQLTRRQKLMAQDYKVN